MSADMTPSDMRTLLAKGKAIRVAREAGLPPAHLWTCPQCGGEGDLLTLTSGQCCGACARDGHARAVGRITVEGAAVRARRRAAAWQKQQREARP